jgi:hypothetical protein
MSGSSHIYSSAGKHVAQSCCIAQTILSDQDTIEGNL